VIEMAKTISTAGGNSGGATELIGLFKSLLDSERESAKRQADHSESILRLMLEDSRARLASVEKQLQERTAAPPAGQEQPSTLEKALDVILRLRGKFDDITGSQEPGGDMPWGARLAQELVPQVFDRADSILKSLAVLRGAASLAQPGPQAAAPQPDAPRAVAPPAPKVMDSPLIKLLKQMHRPIIELIQSGRPGWELAAAILVDPQYGPQAYHWICGQGETGLIGALSTYQPLWSDLMNPEIGQAKAQKFITEFLDTARAQEAVVSLQTPGAARPAPAPSPAATHRGPVVNPRAVTNGPVPPAA
jgi:hypothetical protein